MLRTFWSALALTFVAATFVAVGCGPSGDDDDSTPDPGSSPVITDLSPEPATDDFFYQSELWVEWNVAPEGATYALSKAGEAISGVSETRSSGRVLAFTPDAALESGAEYSVTVSWNSPDSPLTFDFSTGAHGTALEDNATLIGKTFHLDLASADFVTPPGVGPILQSQIGDLAILFSVTDDSNFAANELHILGATGSSDSGAVSQDTCGLTLGFTAGPDGVVGNDDDIPAVWDNPAMSLGPTNLELSTPDFAVMIENLEITGTFHPDLNDMRGGTFAGRIDTRPLVPLLDPEGGDDAVCELVSETVGVDCEECGGGSPGPYCLTIVAEDVTAAKISDSGITPVACDDIISDAATCVDEAASFDPNGDGTYIECPTWMSGDDDDSAAGDDDDSAGM
ncbi:MAG: hypothetical protein CMP23_03900 [Rickettsiales bacterium]|nr:hypothetical protein [Rickettsiales bacterium]|tara:strand:+ start:1552 stop:2739 length:1188 start_codon:yes stop_codon:yes gene_type:complete